MPIDTPRAEILFLTKLIKASNSAELNNLVKNGLSTEVFSTPYKDIINYIFQYNQKYKQLPSENEIVKKFSQLESKLIFTGTTPQAALEAIYDEIVNNSIRISVVDFSEELFKEYSSNGNGFELLDYLNNAVREIQNKYIKARGKVNSLADLTETLKVDFHKLVTGESDGVPIPFLFIQEAMHGWQPAQITSVLAKTGVGKTWWLLLSAVSAACGDPYYFYRPNDIEELSPEKKEQLKSKVLIVSCEMPIIDIARRLGSLITKTSFNRIKAGTLSKEEQNLYFQKLDLIGYLDKDRQAIGVGHNIRILGPEIANSPEQIFAQAEDFNAALVLVDGFYYMNGSGDKRWEKVEGNMQQMRLHTLINNRHYLLASQFKRDARTLQFSSSDDIAFSLSIGQDSNNLIGVYQPGALVKARQLDMSFMKFRDGVQGTAYRYLWDLYENKFEQIGAVINDNENSIESSY